MKDTKRRMEFFSFYDHTGIEAHLARMAEKGWLLDKIGNFTWHYRRIEPKQLTFSVSYFPAASQYDPRPSDKQEMFYDLCAHAGWTLAASSAQMQIFYNERGNPTPIDTDPALEIDAIHRSAKKGYLISQALLGAAALLNLIVLIAYLLQDPVFALCDSATLFRAVCWPALLLLIVIDTGTYFLWRHRALRAAEQGEFLPTSSHPWLQKAVLAVVLAWFGWWLSTLTGGMVLISLASVAGAVAVLLLITGVREILKEKQASAETNKTVTMFLCVALPVLLTAAIPFLVIHGLGGAAGAPATGPDGPSLRMEDLMDTGNLDYPFEDHVNESPLLARYFVNLRAQPQVSHPNDPGLYYTVFVVRFPALYGLCRREVMGTGEYCTPIDPEPWRADEAYYFSRETDYGTRIQRYLLFYPGRVVEFEPNWEPTPDQMAVVGEKLGGV